MKVRLLQQLEDELEALGARPGTFAYDKMYRARKVELCKELQRVPSCNECRAFDHCTLVKQYLVDLRTKVMPKKA